MVGRSEPWRAASLGRCARWAPTPQTCPTLSPRVSASPNTETTGRGCLHSVPFLPPVAPQARAAGRAHRPRAPQFSGVAKPCHFSAPRLPPQLAACSALRQQQVGSLGRRRPPQQLVGCLVQRQHRQQVVDSSVPRPRPRQAAGSSARHPRPRQGGDFSAPRRRQQRGGYLAQRQHRRQAVGSSAPRLPRRRLREVCSAPPRRQRPVVCSARRQRQRPVVCSARRQRRVVCLERRRRQQQVGCSVRRQRPAACLERHRPPAASWAHRQRRPPPRGRSCNLAARSTRCYIPLACYAPSACHALIVPHLSDHATPA